MDIQHQAIGLDFCAVANSFSNALMSVMSTNIMGIKPQNKHAGYFFT